MDLSALRAEYANRPLDLEQLAADPFTQFESWFEEAINSQLIEPNAMVLATALPDGTLTQRTVLLKYFDRRGLVFFTNYGSRKAQQIAVNSRVSLLLLWLPLHRQVEINGVAERISTAESIKYFASRPRGSQLGAWVSRQSSVITARSLLESKLAEIKQKFAAGAVPLPSFWGGYRVAPVRFEFWQGRPDRLHDRFEYLPGKDDQWRLQRLAP